MELKIIKHFDPMTFTPYWTVSNLQEDKILAKINCETIVDFQVNHGMSIDGIFDLIKNTVITERNKQ